MNNNAGIYLHIPFCHSKCTYCSFITRSYEESLATDYLAALAKELQSFAETLPVDAKNIDTIYFGGGTPSIIDTKSIEFLLNLCYQKFTVSADVEITTEMNPADLTAERLKAYRSMGINRASLGIQSFIDRQLISLGRDHSAQDAERGIDQLRQAGFDNISLDLIAGLPDQTLEQWQYNLSHALKISPEHMSIYLLEIKEGTTLFAQVKSGRVSTPDEDLAAEMYEMMLNETAAHGYEHYEISNFAQIEQNRSLRSRHNLKYWLDLPFYGFGVSAHSYNGHQRYSNLISTHAYIEQVNRDGSAIAERKALPTEDATKEALMLRLRLMDGVDVQEFQNHYNFDIFAHYGSELKELAEAELISCVDSRLKLTRRGILLSNEVFMLFI